LLRYNNSMAFAQNAMGWAAAYATGTAPLNLPPIYGPVPVYRPGRTWGAPQGTLVLAQQMLAGPTPGVLPAQSTPPPVTPPPMVETPVDPVPAPIVNSRPVVTPPSYSGDRPKALAAPPVKIDTGRQAVRAAAASPPPVAQSSGGNDGGGKAGGARRGKKGSG
jgi:hypothetical protein